MKRLYRSKDNRIIFGIIGGIGEYAEVDPTILRLIWILFVIITGVFPGLFAYIISALVVPEHPEYRPNKSGAK